MPAPIKLTAILNISGPYNMRPVISAINRQLTGVKANVNVVIDKRSISGINNANLALKQLNTTLSSVSQNASNVRTQIQAIASSLGALNQSSKASVIQATNIVDSINKVSKSTGVAATDMKRFGKEAGLAIKRAGAFSIATGTIFGLVRAISSGISSAISFERGMIRLNQVTGISIKGLRGLNAEIDRLSIGLGVSSSELLDIAKVLAQAGLSARDVKISLEAVAKSSLAASFDDTINTTEGLIAIMGQFRDEVRGTGIGAKDFEKILGSINAVSKAFAVESDDIVAAIRRTGGVFAAASSGIGKPIDQLNELIAVFTSVRATTRESAETIAVGLRTIFTRLQRPQTIEFLRQFGVELTDLEGKFVGPFEAIKRLSEVLRDLSPRDLRFALITEELGGIRQVGKLIPAIKEFGTAQQALGIAIRGQASLTEDAAIAQQSLGIQFDKTREKFLKLIREVTQTNTFQNLTRVALGTLDAFIRITDAVKELIPLMGILLAARTLRALGEFSSGLVGAFRPGAGVGTAATFSSRRRFASGGLVPGQGSMDNVPALLTPGEYVIRKQAVAKLGPNILNRINKYAAGGPITEEDFANKFGSAFRADRKEPFNPALKDRKVAAEYQQAFGRPLTVETFARLQGLRQRVKDRPKEDKIRNILTIDGTTLGFGGVFLKPQNMPDHKESNVTNRIPIGLKNAGVDAVRGNVPGFYINQPEREYIEDVFEKGIRNSISQGAKFIAKDPSFATKNMSTILQRIQLDSIKGSLFEGVLSSYARIATVGSGRQGTFDFVGNETKKFESLFGVPLPQYLDAKLTDTKGARISIIQKALAQFGNLLDPKAARPEKFARGGNVDSVPALLTPGEYVINKRAASRLGRGTLDRLNKGDVQAFQTGGPVQNLAVEIDQAFRKSNAQRQLEAAFGNIAKSSAAVRVGLDAYAQALKNTRGDLVTLQGEFKKGNITQKELNQALQQRKINALKEARQAIRGFNAGIPQDARLAGLFDQAGFHGQQDVRGFPDRPGLFGRLSAFGGRVSSGISSFRGGLNRFAGGPTGNAELDEIRNARIGRAQQASFGLLLAAGAVESILPEPKTAQQARARGGFSGLAAGAGIGTQLGSFAGPQGAIIGGAVGGLVGAFQGASNAFNEFEKSQALSKMEAAISSTNKALDNLAKGIGSSEEALKELAIASRTNLALQIAEANAAAGNSVLNAVGGFFANIPTAFSDITTGATGRDVARRKFGERFQQLTPLARTVADFGVQIQPGVQQQFLAGKLNLSGLDRQTKIALAAANTQAFSKATGQAAADEGLSLQDRVAKLNDLLFEEFEKTVAPSLIKEKQVLDANIASQEAMRISLLKSSKALELFSNDLTKMGEVLSTIPSILNDANILSSAAISRSIGGNVVSKVGGFNPFATLQTSTLTDLKGGFREIKAFTGTSSDLRNTETALLETKRLIDSIPAILGRVLTGEDVDVETKVEKLRTELSRFDAPQQIINQLLSKLGQLATPQGGEGKTNAEIESGIEDILADISPLSKEFSDKYKESLEQIRNAQNEYAQAISDAAQAQKSIDNARFEAEQQRIQSLISIQERETGRVDVRGRFGVQDTAVRRLAGTTDISEIVRSSSIIQRNIQKLEERIVGRRGNLEDIKAKNELENALMDNKKALEILSKNTVKLTAVQEHLQEIEQRKDVGKSFAERIITGGPEEIMKINRELGAVGRLRTRGIGGAFSDKREGESLVAGIATVSSLFPELAKELETKFREGVFGKLGGPLEKRFGRGLTKEEDKAKEAEKVLIESAAKASDALADLADADLANLLRNATEAQLQVVDTLRAAFKLGTPRRANGGFIAGAGTGTSDSIPARLSNGEFVVRASAVKQYGVGFMNALNNGNVEGFAGGGRADHRRALALARLVRRRNDAINFITNPDLEKHREFLATNAPRQFALLQRRAQFLRGIRSRRQAFATRRGFAEGGIANSTGVTITGEALGALNNFSSAATRLSQSLDNLRIPENITMTGTHEVHVRITGAEAFANMQGAIVDLIDQRIAQNVRKNLPLEQRVEGIG